MLEYLIAAVLFLVFAALFGITKVIAGHVWYAIRVKSYTDEEGRTHYYMP